MLGACLIVTGEKLNNVGMVYKDSQTPLLDILYIRRGRCVLRGLLVKSAYCISWRAKHKYSGNNMLNAFQHTC